MAKENPSRHVQRRKYSDNDEHELIDASDRDVGSAVLFCRGGDGEHERIRMECKACRIVGSNGPGYVEDRSLDRCRERDPSDR